MRIGIIGYGNIGQAIAGIHDRNMLMINDIKLEEWEKYSIEKIITGCGWIYICLPTPVGEDGICDTSILEEMFDQLKDFEGFVVSRSTATPKFYSNIVKQTGPYAKYKFRLIYMPVFAQPETALQNLMHPEYIVLGGNVRDINYAAQFIITSDLSYKHKAKIIKTDIAAAAAIKYYIDSFLATKYIWNTEFAAWAQSQGVEWSSMVEGLKENKKLGDSHYDLTNTTDDVGYSDPIIIDNINVVRRIANDSNIALNLIELQANINETIKKAQQDQRDLEAQTRSSLRRRREDRIERAAERKPRRR